MGRSFIPLRGCGERRARSGGTGGELSVLWVVVVVIVTVILGLVLGSLDLRRYFHYHDVDVRTVEANGRRRYYLLNYLTRFRRMHCRRPHAVRETSFFTTMGKISLDYLWKRYEIFHGSIHQGDADGLPTHNALVHKR